VRAKKEINQAEQHGRQLGLADFEFSVQGPRDKGAVYLHTTKEFGVWAAQSLSSCKTVGVAAELTSPV
jgi:hypothetical protein